MDVRDYHGIKGSFDVVLAGPPCIMFSIAGVWKHWKYLDTDIEEKKKALSIVNACFRIIKEIEPIIYVLENPKGFLRRLIGLPTETIYACACGAPWHKPTDLWHNLPKPLRMTCKHEKKEIPRMGFDRITRDPAKRAEWPYGLSEAICLICEEELIYPLKYPKLSPSNFS